MRDRADKGGPGRLVERHPQQAAALLRSNPRRRGSPVSQRAVQVVAGADRMKGRAVNASPAGMTRWIDFRTRRRGGGPRCDRIKSRPTGRKRIRKTPDCCDLITVRRRVRRMSDAWVTLTA